MKQKLLLFVYILSISSIFFFSLFSYLSVVDPKQNMLYELNSKIPSSPLHAFLNALPFFQPLPNPPINKQTQTVYQTTQNDMNAGIAPVIDKDLKLNNVQIQGGLIADGVAQFNSGIITNGNNIDLGTGAIKASNILYGLTQGNGISLGTGQAPIITNTGVLSLQNQTGALSLTGGSGISINGLTISNNDAGSSQNIFKNFGVSGQSTIVAGSNNDTLTFVPGTGISLSSDKTNKYITINASSNALNTSGWTESTGIISENNLADYVGIGTTTPTTSLDVVGNASTSGNLTFRGGGAQQINLLNNSSLGIYNSVSGDTGLRANPALFISSGGNVGIGTNNPSYLLQITAGSSIAFPAFQLVTTNAGLNDTIFEQFNNRSQVGYDGGNTSVYLQGGTSKGLELQTNGANTRLWINAGGQVGIGTTLVGNGAFVVNQPNNAGDIFSASQSGTTRFRIDNSGDLILSNSAATTTFGGIAYTWPTSGQSNNYVLSTNGSGTLSWVAQSGGTNYWQLNSGVLASANTTNDLAIGGSATGSATFQIFANTGNATTSGTLTFNTAGNIQTTKNQTLTLGGNSTGNITLMPQNGNGFVGIGTNNPINGLLDVEQTSTLTSGSYNMNYNAATANPASTSSASYTALINNVFTTGGSNTDLSGASIVAMNNTAKYSGTATLNSAYGIQSKVTNGSSGTLNNAYGASISMQNLNGGSISNSISLVLNNPTIGTGSITKDAGVNVVNFTNATNNTNLLLGTSSIPNGNFSIYNASSYNNYFAGSLGVGTTAVGNGEMIINQPNSAGDVFSASQSGTTKFKITNAGNVVYGNAALATNATDGFLYLDTSAGAPSGTPTSYTGTVPMEYDTTNNKLMVYNGSWKTTTAFADYAEWADAPGAQSGDIVTITNQKNPTADETDPFVLAKATTSYDQKIAGVVSQYAEDAQSANGYKKSSDYHAVALIGRVPVKVSSINGNIQAGDYLTSSSISGVAQKATKAGMMIGKALEDYNNTNPQQIGQIMVLVNVSYADPNYQIALTNTGDLSVNGQPIANSPSNALLPNNTFSSATTQNTPLSVTTDQFNTLSITVTSLQNQIASMSSQLGKIDDLSKQLADLQKTVNLSQSLQETATQSGVLGAATTTNDTSLEGNLNVLGRTLLGTVGITGQVTDGLLTINGMDSSDGTASATINTLSGPLKLQSLALGGIDFLNGKATIDQQGNLNVADAITAKKYNVDTSDPASASIGEATLPVGQTGVEVKTTSLTDTSKIFVEPEDTPVTTAVKKTGSDTFTIKVRQAQLTDLKLNWWIVN